MVFKEKFTATPEYDSEGHVLALPATLSEAEQQFVVDHELLHAMFDGRAGDVQCENCEPLRLRSLYGRDQQGEPVKMPPNPKGWQEVDGVALPSVSPWADLEPHHERLRSSAREQGLATFCLSFGEPCKPGEFCACAARDE